MSDYQSTFTAGQHLFEQGEVGDCAFIIESGTVEVYTHQNDHKLIIATLSEGDLLGEMAIIDELPRTASALAVEDTEVIVIPRGYIRQKIECSDPTVRFFLMIIMERYRDMHARLMHVFKGIQPEECELQEMFSTTTNVVKKLMHQYVDMQDRILSAVNTAAPISSHQSVTNDVSMTRRSLNIENQIDAGLANQEFRLFYQPMVALESGRIVGCEALVRWQHPARGLLSPFDFIAHAENSGQIVELGYWIMQHACEFQNQIAKQYSEEFFTSVNLSARQFEDGNLVNRINDIIHQHASAADRIKIEITESLLMSNPEMALEALNNLKQGGAKLAIDDFGTGYSSLSYLHKFPFDTLKIDRSFVSTMLQNKKSNEIVKSLIDLAHTLGMEVVAEGIETEYEEALVRQYRADLGQGYKFAKPVAAKDFINLLA